MGVGGQILAARARGCLAPPYSPPCPPPQARTIFAKGTQVNFKQVDDLASVWCEAGEMELRHHNYDQALRLLRVCDHCLPGCGVGIRAAHEVGGANTCWGS